MSDLKVFIYKQNIYIFMTDCSIMANIMILEWVDILFSREPPDLRIKPEPPVSALADRFFTTEPPGKSHLTHE